jgi:hypothetical protein
MDYPGQKNICRAIVYRMINKEQSDVPPQILNIIPLIRPLHISLTVGKLYFWSITIFLKKCTIQYSDLEKFLLKSQNRNKSTFFWNSHLRDGL